MTTYNSQTDNLPVPLTARTVLDATYGFFTAAPSSSAGAVSLTTQRLVLAYFRVPIGITIGHLKTVVSTYTATGHTYAGMGLYTEASTGDLTLIAKVEDTGSPPTFLGSATAFVSGSASVPALSAAPAVSYGDSMALGVLAVFTGGGISITGGTLFSDVGGWRADMNLGPGVRRAVAVGSQSSLPSSITNATLVSGTQVGSYPIARLYP